MTEDGFSICPFLELARLKEEIKHLFGLDKSEKQLIRKASFGQIDMLKAQGLVRQFVVQMEHWYFDCNNCNLEVQAKAEQIVQDSQFICLIIDIIRLAANPQQLEQKIRKEKQSPTRVSKR